MNSSLKHQPLIAEILPGALTLGLLLFAYNKANPNFLIHLVSGNVIQLLVASGLVLFGSWIVGTCLDAVRNLFENIWDKWWPLNWDFFFSGDIVKVHQLEEYYYAYYTLDGNFVVGITFLFITQFLTNFLPLAKLPCWLLFLLFLTLLIFLFDAIGFREEIRKLIGYNKALPHDGIYARLKPSPIHGVGVFAIRDIPKGASIFSNDKSEMIWIDKKEFANVDPELKKLYDDFCVIKGNKYGCPKNFNMLTVGWYLNESKSIPNVQCTEDYDFIAIRDIKRDEELLIDYSTYSDYPKEKLCLGQQVPAVGRKTFTAEQEN